MNMLVSSGPQQTKKKQQWAAKIAAANASSNTNQNTQWQRRGLREPSFEVKTEWEVIQEFNKQHFDKLLALVPGNNGTEVSAGKIPAFDPQWEKCKIKTGKKLPKTEGYINFEHTYRDAII